MKIKQPNEVETTADQWWFIYDESALTLVIPPQQCSGRTSSPHTMVICDTEEECRAEVARLDLNHGATNDFLEIV
jgi:hypothetical protein